MLLIDLIIDFYPRYGMGSKKTESFNLCSSLTLSVRNGQSFSFGTHVPWIRHAQFTAVYREIPTSAAIDFLDSFVCSVDRWAIYWSIICVTVTYT